MFLGGRINSRDVWMYNSQLNLWIRVASLNKGRWRHRMCVLLGKVRRETQDLNQMYAGALNGGIDIKSVSDFLYLHSTAYSQTSIC